MAFATANVRKSVFGDLKVTAGDWTETLPGQDNATYSVEGGRVYMVRFDSQDSTNSPRQEVPTFVTTSAGAGLTTVSIANRKAVTTGRFLIIHA